MSFNLPIISIGNLNSGGTGKTPHVEYLVRLLDDDFLIATLSRGYKRNTKGFILADEKTSLSKIGDEPFQFKTKFKNAIIAVDEKRVRGTKAILALDKIPDVIILDDAFQHRHIKPGLSILLTDFYNLYSKDRMLPTGNLREYKKGAQRADIIIVTKSPKVLSPFTRRRLADQLKPRPGQSLYFSYIRHGKLLQIPGVEYIPESTCHFSSILMVAGIANPYPLELYLKDRCTSFEKLIFPDHHNFAEKDINMIVKKFDKIFTKNKIIVTTEKDMLRLIQPEVINRIQHLPICYLPIVVKLHKDDKEAFDNQILSYVRSY